MSESVREKEQFDVCLPGLLDEVLSNESCSILFIPINITKRILAELAGVAIEIDDARLHRMMLRLGLYDCDYRERTKKKAEMEAEIKASQTAVNERAMLRGLVREMIDKLDEAWDFINRIDARAEEVCDGLHEEMEKARKALGEEAEDGNY